VRLRGYCSNDEIKVRLEEADILINTSHAEGLGLPLLEAQYAGVLVVAPERRVFREVLGSSGLFVEPDDQVSAAKAIASATESSKWRARFAELASVNLSRWNTAARHDRAAVAKFLMTMERQRRQ
jgi:glycosyltransferase involved in cell wall biosynthesis